MSLINWDDSLSVKVAEIDSQHQKLIDLINQLHELMKAGQGKDAISPILNELTSYTVTHFSTEEKYFDQFIFEESSTHKSEHKKFVDKVSAFKTDFDAGNANLSIELMNFLRDWLINHIKGTDQRYVKCFTENGLS